MIPKFSICIIAKNEERTLPKLAASIKHFLDAKGEVMLLDTGSTDNTRQVALELGFTVITGQFKQTIHEDLARKINKKFSYDEGPIVEAGQTLFDFSSARNFCALHAKNDMICTMDGDEAYTTFNLERINELIEEGYEQFNYQFVYAHDQSGRPTVQFVQSKFYDRRKVKWSGIVHEVLGGDAKSTYVGEDVIKLEHYQEGGKDHRANYLPGLAVDCYENPFKDRQSHYFAREMMYRGMWKSSIHEFERHISMKAWNTERGQSMIYMARCYGHLNKPEKQYEWLAKGYLEDTSRRTALIEIALYFQHNDNKLGAKAFAQAALQVPWSDYYSNDKYHYEDAPHSVLYWANGFLGDIPSAQYHILKALEFQPYNAIYLRDTKYYFEYPDNGITGWMVFDELQWLYEEAKKHKVIVEVGSWKGKSTHALASGAKKNDGRVTCVDSWKGSEDPMDATNWMAKEEDVFAIFKENILDKFDNVNEVVSDATKGAEYFDDHSIDFLFLDASHTKEQVLMNLNAWLPKMKPRGVISGHDYTEGTWMGVVEAVNMTFGKHSVRRHGYSIWSVQLDGTVDKPFITMENGKNVEFPKLTAVKDRIPKRIYTAWLGDEPMPENVKKCIESQKIPGYEHHILTNDDVLNMTDPYIRTAMLARKWVKAVDYLRFITLFNYGGIFLDADVMVTNGKGFDSLLNEQLFVGKEMENPDGSIVLGCAVLGSEMGHPLIQEILDAMTTEYRGDDDFNYESSMGLLNTMGVRYQDRMRILPQEVFYPYNWRAGTTKETENTICNHLFLRSWAPQTWVDKAMDDARKQLKENSANVIMAGKPRMEIANLGKLPPPEILSTDIYPVLIKNLRAGIYFSFVKWGDGEIAATDPGCENGRNCDGQTYKTDLRYALLEARQYFDTTKWVNVVHWNDQKNFNCLLHRDDNDPSEFFKLIINSNRKKIYIGPRKLTEVATLLKCFAHVTIPEMEAWDAMEEIWSRIPFVDNAIYLVSGGPMAKVLIARLMKGLTHATYIDLGSSFDPLYAKSRTHQMSREDILSLYGYNDQNNSENDRYNKNIKLPQRGHPEVDWVRTQIHGYEKSVVDVGCGDHKTIPHALGVDIRPVTDEVGDLDLSSIHGDFDVIISRHSLEHSLDQQKTIKGWIQHLKDNSKIIVVLPDHEYIDTMKPMYGNGEHLHAYTRESFRNFLSLFPVFYISKQETVMDKWSFGTTIHYNLPTVLIIIPHVKGTRQASLDRLMKSISKLNYPEDLITIDIEDGEGTVPKKVNLAAKHAYQKDIEHQPDIFCYMGDDAEFTPDALLNAVGMTKQWGLVSFNSGKILPDEGNICEHFVMTKAFYRQQGYKIFDERLHHCGVDNLLWAQASRIKQARWAEHAVIKHHAGDRRDPVYEKGWAHVAEDRKLLAELLKAPKLEAR